MNRAERELLRLAEAQKNIFKKTAFKKAASSLSLYTDNELLSMTQRELERIPGVGRSSAAVVAELYSKGRSDRVESEALPANCDLTKLRGVGFATAKSIIDKYGVTTIAELKKVKDLPSKLYNAIELYERLSSRMPLSDARKLAHRVVRFTETVCPSATVTPVGSLRRFRSTIGDLDFVVKGASPRELARAFRRFNARGETKNGITKVELEGVGENKLLANFSTEEENSVHVDFVCPPPKQYGASLLYLTGSKQFNIAMRKYAAERGFVLNEHGLFTKQGQRVASRTEQEIFERLGMPFVPPEMREMHHTPFDNRLTDEAFVNAVSTLPKPHTFHTHTQFSDGVLSPSTLVRLATAMTSSRKLVGISDHSYPNPSGITKADITRYVNACRATRVLCGVELEVMADGKLPKMFRNKNVLAKFDYFVLACHIKPNFDIVNRIAKALAVLPKNKPIILAHLTGRVIGLREGYIFSLEDRKRLVSLFKKRRNLVLEINGFIDRLDPPSELLQWLNKYVKPPVVLSSDAHTSDDLHTNFLNAHRQMMRGHVTRGQVFAGMKILMKVR